MRLNTGSKAVNHFIALDAQLPHPTMPDGVVLEDIGERLKYMRHPAAHGAISDTSAEGCFYALLLTIIAFGSNILH